jgi:hypothetical protein
MGTRGAAEDDQGTARSTELAISEEDVERFRRDGDAMAYENIEAACLRYVRSIHGGGLLAEDLEDIVADAFADELPSLQSHDVSVPELKSTFRRALERHRKRAKRHNVRHVQADPHPWVISHADLTIARQHLIGVVETIEVHMQKSLRSLSPRDRVLVVSAYGLEGAVGKAEESASVELRFRSPAARRKAIWRALQRFNRALEWHLMAALETATRHHRGVLEDALDIVRGSAVEHAFAAARSAEEELVR